MNKTGRNAPNAAPEYAKGIRPKQRALLKALVKYYGGELGFRRYIARKSKGMIVLKRQAPRNWVTRGKVSLKMVVPLAKLLECSPHALNYGGITPITGDMPPPWEDVVRTLKMIEVEDRIQSIKI